MFASLLSAAEQHPVGSGGVVAVSCETSQTDGMVEINTRP